MIKTKIVKYEDTVLTGECVEGFQNFRISDIPFYTLYHQGHERINLVKCSHFRRVVYLKWSDKDGILPKDSDKGIPVYVKQSRIRHTKKKIGKIFVKNKSLFEWELGRKCIQAGIPTAMPILWAKGKLPDEEDASYLIQLSLEGADDIRGVLEKRNDSLFTHRAIRESARFICEIHRKNFYHDDLSTKNLLIKENPGADGSNKSIELFVIDLDRSKFCGRLSWTKKMKTLLKFAYSIPRKVKSKNIILRFLSEYSKSAGVSNYLSRKKYIRKMICRMRILGLFKGTRLFP